MVDTLTDRFILCRTIAVEVLPALRQASRNTTNTSASTLDNSFNSSSNPISSSLSSSFSTTTVASSSSSEPLLRTTVHSTARILQQAVNLSIENEQTKYHSNPNHSQSALALVASLLDDPSPRSTTTETTIHPSPSSSSSTVTTDRQIIHKSIAYFLGLTESSFVTDVETLRNWLAALLLQRLATNVPTLCTYLGIDQTSSSSLLTTWLENTDTLFFSLDIRGTGSLNLQEFVWFTLAIYTYCREYYYSTIASSAVTEYPYLYTIDLWTDPAYFLSIVALWMNTLINDTTTNSRTDVKPILREGEGLLLQRLGYISLPLWRTWLANQWSTYSLQNYGTTSNPTKLSLSISHRTEMMQTIQSFRDYIERCGAALGVMENNNHITKDTSSSVDTVFDLHKSWYRCSMNGVQEAVRIYSLSFAGLPYPDKYALLHEASTLLIACMNSIGSSSLLAIVKEGRSISDGVSTITSSVVAILSHIPSHNDGTNNNNTDNHGSIANASVVSLACSLAPNAVQYTVQEYVAALRAQLPTAVTILTNEYGEYAKDSSSSSRTASTIPNALPPFVIQAFLTVVQKVYEERYLRKMPIKTNVSSSATVSRIPAPLILPSSSSSSSSTVPTVTPSNVTAPISPTKPTSTNTISTTTNSTSTGSLQVWSPKLRSPLKQLVASAVNEKMNTSTVNTSLSLPSPDSKEINPLVPRAVSPVTIAVQTILTTTMVHERENRKDHKNDEKTISLKLSPQKMAVTEAKPLLSSRGTTNNPKVGSESPMTASVTKENTAIENTTITNSKTDVTNSMVPTFSISLDELIDDPNNVNNNNNIDTVQVSLSFDDETITAYDDTSQPESGEMKNNDDDNESVPPPPPSTDTVETYQATLFDDDTSDSDESSVLEFQPLRMASIPSSLSSVTPTVPSVALPSFSFASLPPPPPPPPPMTNRKKKTSLSNTATTNTPNVYTLVPVSSSDSSTTEPIQSIPRPFTAAVSSTPLIPVQYANEYSQLENQLNEYLDNLLDPTLQLDQRDHILALMRQIRQRLRILQVNSTNSSSVSFVTGSGSKTKNTSTKLFASPSLSVPSILHDHSATTRSDTSSPHPAEPLVFPVNLQQSFSPTDSVRSGTIDTLPAMDILTSATNNIDNSRSVILSRPSVDRYFPSSPDLTVVAIQAANAATTAANAVMKVTEDLRKANLLDIPINNDDNESRISQPSSLLNLDDEIANASSRPDRVPSVSTKKPSIVSNRSVSRGPTQQHGRSSVQWNDNATIHNYTMTTALDATLSRSRIDETNNHGHPKYHNTTKTADGNTIIKIIHEKGIVFDGTLPLLRGNNLAQLPVNKSTNTKEGNSSTMNRSQSVTRIGKSTAASTENPPKVPGSRSASRSRTPIVRTEPTYANKSTPSTRKSIGTPVLQTMIRANHSLSQEKPHETAISTLTNERHGVPTTTNDRKSIIPQRNTVSNGSSKVSNTKENNNGLRNHPSTTTARGTGIITVPSSMLATITPPSTVLPNVTNPVISFPSSVPSSLPILIPSQTTTSINGMKIFSTEPLEEDDNVSVIHTVPDDDSSSSSSSKEASSSPLSSAFITPMYNSTIPSTTGNTNEGPTTSSPLLLLDNATNGSASTWTAITNTTNSIVPSEPPLTATEPSISTISPSPSPPSTTFSWPSLPLDQMMVVTGSDNALPSGPRLVTPSSLPPYNVLRTPIIHDRSSVNIPGISNNNLTNTFLLPSSKGMNTNGSNNPVIHPRLRKFQLADGRVFGTSPPQFREKSTNGSPTNRSGDGAGSISILLPKNNSNHKGNTVTQSTTGRKSISQSTISRLHAGISTRKTR